MQSALLRISIAFSWTWRGSRVMRKEALMPASLVASGLATLVLLAFANPVLAHRFAPSLFQVIEIEPQHFAVLWKEPIARASAVPLEPQVPDGCQVVHESPAVEEGTGRVFRFQWRCDTDGAGGLYGRGVGVAGLAENQASAILLLSLHDGRVFQASLTAVQPVFSVPRVPSFWGVSRMYVPLGVEHILRGADHLLFILALVLLVRKGRPLIWTLSFFTVGHSVTLALVSLGILTVPESFAELLIAASIFLLAVVLAGPARPLSEGGWQGVVIDHPWWLAGGFGLIHGLGFAGALAELGIPEGAVATALLGFNLGIEIGQLLFVGVVFLLAEMPWFRPLSSAVRGAGVYIIGGASAYWCFDRLGELLT